MPTPISASAQNGSDAVANGGATVLAQKLGGSTKTDPSRRR